MSVDADELSAYMWHLPHGFPEPSVPADNPMSTTKVALGKRLFFEARLSITATYSCASCHNPASAFTDARALAIGATGQVLKRNAMALVNVVYNASYGWANAKVTTLEAQMRQPLFNQHPIEMGLAGRETNVVAMLAAESNYADAFRAAFPAEPNSISIDNVIRAIACYERTLISGNSPFDRYVFGGEHEAMDESAKHGMKLFYSKRLGCANCHAGFNFTGTTVDTMHTTAVPAFARNGVRDKPTRVPTLRNIAVTAPYMHDGRYATLETVIAHYENTATRQNADARLGRFKLTADERQALLAFLDSLTDNEFIRTQNEP